MAWYAEAKRRGYRCFHGLDLISWYSDISYYDWWDYLSPEAQAKVIAHRERKRQIRKKQAINSLMSIGACMLAMAGVDPLARQEFRNSMKEMYGYE